MPVSALTVRKLAGGRVIGTATRVPAGGWECIAYDDGQEIARDHLASLEAFKRWLAFYSIPIEGPTN